MKFNGQDHPNGEFAQRVYAIVAQIPKGRVMTYGQLAALVGNARAAVTHRSLPESMHA